MSGGGWGAGFWGGSPWGAGTTDPLAIVTAVAVRENTVRVLFNTAPLFDLTLSPNDASNPERFSIVEDASTTGFDGSPARPVTPVYVERVAFAGAGGAILDVTVDRPFSPYPTFYRVSANQLVAAASGLPLDPARASFRFEGNYRVLRNAQAEATVPSRDVANPQNFEALVAGGDPVPVPSEDLLGTFPTDASGDYAFDQGLVQIKKRIFRRLMTQPGAFPAMPDYGVGIPSFVKKLGLAAIRAKLAAESQRQILLEPGVVAAEVTMTSDPAQPSVTILTVKARTSELNVGFSFPIAPP